MNNLLLNDQQIIEEIREEIKKFLESNAKECTKVVLTGKFIALSSYV
jgi:hypothetical protein